jgi:hypothetical protein
MALGSTQPLIEISTWNHPEWGRGGKALPARKADDLTAICEPIVQKICDSRPFTTVLGLHGLLQGYKDSFAFYLT